MWRIAHVCIVLGPLVVALAPTHALGQTAESVRALIVERVGDLQALQVPAGDEDLPQPDDPRFRITPEKKRLGKLLFFDPVRNNDVRPEFGGVRSLAQTASCGSCHMGEAASKAGQVLNFGQGAEGRGFVDPLTGRFVARRDPLAALVDLAPTQFERTDAIGNIVLSGRFDAVDSVPRLSPSIIGFAFNQRLLWDGAAGEPYDPSNPDKANANPRNLPAGESLIERANRAHRMLDTQRFALQQHPAYMKMFKRAFPEAAAAYEGSGNLDDLCNNELVERAMAAFLRTVVTRDTPYDRFLAGDDSALTSRQLRGAWLFFAVANAGGANCVACHSGPMLNKVLGDEAGLLVEENFHNLGIGEHPLQDLMREAKLDPTHRDTGRGGVTGDPADNFEFKTPTLRQMRDAAPFFHDGSVTTLRDAVEYINDGLPASAETADAGTLSPLFTNPRGPEEMGLGLTDEDVTALVDFLENGLYDPGFVHHDPDSPTETFELNARDLTYDLELRLAGAVNGFVPSLLPHPQTDALSLADSESQTPPLLFPPLCGAIDLLTISMAFAALASWCVGAMSTSRARRRL